MDLIGNMNYSKKGKKLTNEEFDQKINNSNFFRIDNYINSKTSITFECKLCKKRYKKKPKEFKKLKCKCLEHGEKYKKDISEKHIIVLENYINAKKKILHKCEDCDTHFKSSPKVVKNSKYGCPVCSGKKFNLEKYKSLLPDNIGIIGKYIDTSKKVSHKCKDCNNIWETKPNYILHMGTGCPKCNSSKGERIISDILSKMNINYIKEYSVNISGINYRFDFYIEKYNILIEYDGIQHFKPVKFFGGDTQYEIIKNSDRIKDDWAKKENFNLIRIPYDIENIEDYVSQLIYSSVKKLY
jgi:very-short-patch-repair endonuclease